MENNVIKRIVIFIKFQLLSPLSVSSGFDDLTDSDVIRDYDGKPFVPGSSLAGAIRAYLDKDEDRECLMGYTRIITDINEENKETGKMSPLFISDFNFYNEQPRTNVRDNVALDENKTITNKKGAKFDTEIIQAGAKGYFFMELTVRKNNKDKEEEMKQNIAKAIKGLDNGEIRLGSKKTRGFGQVKIIKVAEKNYCKENWLEYADAYDLSKWDKKDNSDNILRDNNSWINKYSFDKKMVHIEVPLKMKGGISIRQYAAKGGEPDFVHLTDNEEPVIPGSSMAGALRSRILQILKDIEEVEGYNLFPANANNIIETAFGYVQETSKKAHISDIIISEIIIEKAKPLEMVRTAISPFESSAKKGALYRELTYVDGVMNLRILVRKHTNSTWIIGLLMLALRDLREGLLAVGGQTAIGRGILLGNGPIAIDGDENKEDCYIAQLMPKITSDYHDLHEGGSH